MKVGVARLGDDAAIAVRHLTVSTPLAGLFGIVLFLGTAACGAAGDAPSALATDTAAPAKARTGPNARFEVRRQNSERGGPEETTRTTLRLDTFFTDGPITQWRLDVPLPDDKSDFEGNLFDPRLGDIKTRANFRAFRSGDYRVYADTEWTFPTAATKEGGAGKVQVSAALHGVTVDPVMMFAEGRHAVRFEWNLRQTVSVAGDESRKDINNTKPELVLRDVFADYWLKLTWKPVIDWVQDGKTGAVMELEGGWNASREWRFSLMGGRRLWGDGTPGTYGKRVELVAGRALWQ